LSPLDRAWAFATAIININTGENYTVNDVKKMDKNHWQELANPAKSNKGGYEKGGVRELERRTGIEKLSRKTVEGTRDKRMCSTMATF